MFEVFHGASLANSLMALVPAIIVIVLVYKRDKIEKESKLLIVFLIFLGMLSAFITNKVGSPIASSLAGVIPQNHLFFIIICDFFIIALLEEGLKYWSIKLPTWNSSEFDFIFDGIVYGASVGIGFAIYEAFTHAGQAEFSIMVIRSLSSLSGHFGYGVIMGALYGFARAKDSENDEKGSKAFRSLAFIVPWLLHGIYDFMADLASYGIGSLGICYLFSGIVTLAAIILLVIISKKDVRI